MPGSQRPALAYVADGGRSPHAYCCTTSSSFLERQAALSEQYESVIKHLHDQMGGLQQELEQAHEETKAAGAAGAAGGFSGSGPQSSPRSVKTAPVGALGDSGSHLSQEGNASMWPTSD